MKIAELVGQSVTLKIKEVFGTVKAKVMAIDAANGIATITFKSFGSAYTQIVPLTALSTKNTEGTPTPITKGGEVTVTLDTAEITTKKVKVEDLNNIGILAKVGGSVRLLTWNDIKEVRFSPEDSESEASATRAPRAAAAPKAAPAKAAAPKAPGKR